MLTDTKSENEKFTSILNTLEKMVNVVQETSMKHPPNDTQLLSTKAIYESCNKNSQLSNGKYYEFDLQSLCCCNKLCLYL